MTSEVDYEYDTSHAILLVEKHIPIVIRNMYARSK